MTEFSFFVIEIEHCGTRVTPLRLRGLAAGLLYNIAHARISRKVGGVQVDSRWRMVQVMLAFNHGMIAEYKGM